MSAPKRIVVVGAGASGTTAALGLRQRGFAGSIVLVGEEATEPYDRPALSKAMLADRSSRAEPIATTEELVGADIEWRTETSAVELDADNRRLALGDGSTLGYDRLLLSTGARARHHPLIGSDAITVRTSTEAAQLQQRLAAPAHVVIIGGGAVGLEVAAAARQAGCDVTVVEFAHQLLAHIAPAPVAAVVRDRHADAGVDVRLGTAVTQWSHDEQTGLHLVSLDDGTELRADVIVVDVGTVPRTELAATAGLSLDNGIAVDAQLRTSDPAVWAAGDCCSVPHPAYDERRVRIETWQSALAQAEVAADNLLGGTSIFDAVPSFWSDQYDLRLQTVGLHDTASRHVVRRRRDEHEVHIGLDGDGRVVAASGASPGMTLTDDIAAIEQLIAARAMPSEADLVDPDCALDQLADS